LKLTSIITFPTRIQNISATAIDNMFLDSSRLKDHVVTPICNGLSDHDAQVLTIKIKVPKDQTKELKTRRNNNNHTISRQQLNFHQPIANCTKYQKGIWV
jgi:hypothetical protein